MGHGIKLKKTPKHHNSMLLYLDVRHSMSSRISGLFSATRSRHKIQFSYLNHTDVSTKS